MTIEDALWMQNVDYPARLDRALIAAMYDEGVMDLLQFKVSEREAGANYTVDVQAGKAVVAGDDEANQGNYYVSSTSTENVTVGAAPGSNSRIDLVVLRVNDENAGGPVTNDVTIEVIAGTVAASPVAPTLPDSAIALAEIGPIAPSTVAITDSLVTDVRQIAGRKAAPATLEWRADGVVPSGWLLSGPDYDPDDYPALFAHIGTQYGGNGSTTFGTPDADGRVLIGPGGAVGGSQGDVGGAATHTLTAAQLPSHTHTIPAHSHALPSHTHTTPGHTHSIAHDHPATTSTSGGGHSHSLPGSTTFMGYNAASGSQVASGAGYGLDLAANTDSASAHTHSVNIPSFSGNSGTGGAGTSGAWSGTSDAAAATVTGSIGSGSPHNITQPYQVVGALVIRT